MSLALPFTIVGSATLLSRVTGFVRDILIAALLGTSAIADIYVAAFLLPNLIRRMMSEGALNASIIPRLARLEQEGGKQAAQGYSEDVFSLLAAVSILLVILAEIFMPELMGVLAHGFRDDAGKMSDSVLFARIAFPFVGLSLIVAFLSALLNSIERYAIAALVPVILNLLLIGVMLALLSGSALGQRQTGLVLITTVLVAGFVQFGFLWVSAWRAGFGVRPRIIDALRGKIDPSVKTLLLLALPSMMIAGSGHLHMVIAGLFAALEPRGLALLYYADRLFQLPLGFVASAIGVVLLSRVSRAYRQNDAAAIAGAQSESLAFASLLILPAATGLHVLSEPLIAVLFQRGAFTGADAAATAANLRVLALALPAFAMIMVILPSFLSREALRTPVLAVLVAFSANITAAIIARSAGLSIAPGIGVAVGTWTNALLLVLAVLGRFPLHPGTLKRILAAGVAAAFMGGTVTFLAGLSQQALVPDQPFALRAGILLGLCLSGIVTYLMAANLLGAIDLRALLARARSPST